MGKLTFYPIGNADSTLIRLGNGDRILFDFADMRNPNDKADKRIDLAAKLWEDLEEARINTYRVFAVTHLDLDHTYRARSFFYLDHAAAYQEGKRAKFASMWVPANVITESRNDLGDDAKALQAEARYRFEKGYGIRVFSRPQKLKDWLAGKGIRLEDRAHLITDAGQEPPEFSLDRDGLVFFAHSPFAWRQDDGDVVDRNGDSLVVQARFRVGATETRVILGSDSDHAALSDIVRLTKRHKREDKLIWDVFKLPHHCSYLTLGPDKGEDKTVPVPDVKWLFEYRGQRGGIIVSTSWPIPVKGSAEDKDPQPPHRQAAAYYRDVKALLDGEFVVTMEHPKAAAPEPLVIEIDGLGARVKKVQAIGAAAITTSAAPRAG